MKFKPFISSVLILITLIVHAHATPHNGVKAAFDELNYSLSVEWDQKNETFLNDQSEKFNKEMRRLRSEGLSNQEILSTLLNELQNKNLARDIETTFSMVSINKMTSDEAETHIKQLISRSYKTGASWSGSSAATGAVIAIALIAVLAFVFQDKIKSAGEKCYMAYKCNEQCTILGCEQVCGEECI